MERWREALLWTFVVANLGGTEGQWGDSARKHVKDLFDITDADNDVLGIEVYRGERWTIERMCVDKTFDQLGWKSPMRTKYLFCECVDLSILLTHQPLLTAICRPSSSPARNRRRTTSMPLKERPSS